MLAKLLLHNGGMARTSSALIPSFDRFFDEAFGLQTFAGSAMAPAADVAETDAELQVTIDLPGHDPKNVKVEVEHDVLTIRAERHQERTDPGRSQLRRERSYGVYARSFVLPSTVDGSKAQARYQNGVLTVTLPKREEAKPKSIDVKVES